MKIVEKHIQQILSHELGHYIYFFKDINPSEFFNICWENAEITCLLQEFVSDYATRSQEEDYAESFAYWLLYHEDNEYDTTPDNPINKKFTYFQKLFEKTNDNEN